MTGLARLGSILSKSLIALVLIEAIIRGAAGLGLVNLPPRHLAGFDALQAFRLGARPTKRLFRPDPDLIQRLNRNFLMVYDRRIAFPDRPRTYTVRTNEDGFRTPPFTRAKRPGTFRIVCLGDSSTFGLNVDAESAYPAVLGEALEKHFPGRFEVLNLGTPGYTSRQGLELVRQLVLDLDPDLVTFAFGVNDQIFSGPLSDEQAISFNQSRIGRLIYRLRDGLDRLYTHRLLRKTMARFMQRPTAAPTGETKNRRVSLDEIRDAVVATHDLLAEHDAMLLVLNNDFTAGPARKGLRAGAMKSGARLLDMQRTLLSARRGRARRWEEQRGLSPGEARQGEILLRVLAPGVRDVRVHLTLPGAGKEFVSMRDDGRDGDQVEDDGIWSAYVPGLAGKSALRYTYHGVRGTQSELEFTHATVLPGSRIQVAPPSGIGEIDVFGTMYLFSDGSHPDEEGHQRIADLLFRSVLTTEAARAFLRGHSS